jgi:hypothetical protein
MRNLKRVLALALALVMTLSLMVMTGSAASYSDADQISDDYTVAVDVLSGLGVFKGKGTSDGATFAPKEILDRGSAAALIYRVITGDVEKKGLVNYQYAVYSDMADSDWYTPYVTYCSNGGYIKGYDGRFSPLSPSPAFRPWPSCSALLAMARTASSRATAGRTGSCPCPTRRA